MDPLWFKYLYLAGVLFTYLVRISGVTETARHSKKEDMLSPKDKVKREGVLISVIMLFWFAASQVLPIFYTIHKCLCFRGNLKTLLAGDPGYCGLHFCALAFMAGAS